MKRFGFTGLGSYALITAFIVSAGVYYTNSNNLKRLSAVREVTGEELYTKIFRDGVSVYGTLTHITFRESSNTAVLHFVSRDMQDINVLVPMNMQMLASSNLELGQSYKITGTPLARGTLSIKSLDQLEKSNPIQQIDYLESICLRNIVRQTTNSGYGTVCDNTTVIKYVSSVPVHEGKHYLGYWTEHVHTGEYTFNILGLKP